MRLEEESMYQQYILAGGKKEDWEWTYHIEYHYKAGVTPEIFGDRFVASLGMNKTKITQAAGYTDDIIRTKNLSKIKQLEDGTFEDEEGNKVEIPEGYTFIPAQ